MVGRSVAARGVSEPLRQFVNDAPYEREPLLLNARWVIGRRADGFDYRREEAAAVLEELAEHIARLGPLDARWELPLGFAASARRPAGP
jgi:hypothetical protein